MNKDLQALIELQQIDLKIIESERRIQSVPYQIQEVDQAIQQSASHLLSLKNQQTEKQKLRRQDDVEVETLRLKLIKYKDQLMSVKNNREYSAMLKEIENCEGEIKKVEDRILENMVTVENLGEEIQAAEKQFKLEECELLRQKQELEALASNHQHDHQELMAIQSGIEEQIKRSWLLEYRKISERRNGIGLAEAKNGCCMVCRVRMRPQVFTDIRMGDNLRHCDNCGRILYRLDPIRPVSGPEPLSEEEASLPEEETESITESA